MLKLLEKIFIIKMEWKIFKGTIGFIFGSIILLSILGVCYDILIFLKGHIGLLILLGILGYLIYKVVLPIRRMWIETCNEVRQEQKECEERLRRIREK